MLTDDSTVVSRVVGLSEGSTNLYQKSSLNGGGYEACLVEKVSEVQSVCGWKSFRFRGSIIDRLTLKGEC